MGAFAVALGRAASRGYCRLCAWFCFSDDAGRCQMGSSAKAVRPVPAWPASSGCYDGTAGAITGFGLLETEPECRGNAGQERRSLAGRVCARQDGQTFWDIDPRG
jgi:hypothetical protein